MLHASMRSTHALSATLALAALWPTPVRAQSAASGSRPVAFEVASIKPHTSRDAVETVSLQPGGGLRLLGFRLRTLIRVAYATGTTLTPEQVIGGPAWLDADRF